MKSTLAGLLLILSCHARANPLTDAINIGDQMSVLNLLDNGADPNKVGPNEDSPLLQAVSAGQDEIALALIARGASLDVKDGEKKESILFEVVRLGEDEVLKEILRRRPDLIDKANSDGDTPLLEAVRSSQSSCARTLLEAGARKDVRNKAGQKPTDLLSPTDKDLLEVFAQSNGRRHPIRRRHH